MIRRKYNQPGAFETKLLLGCATLLLLASLFIFVKSSEIVLRINLILQVVLLIEASKWSSHQSGTWLNPPQVVIAAIFLWHSPVLIGRFFIPEFASTGNTFTYGEAYVPEVVSLISSCMALFCYGIIIAYRERRKPIATSFARKSAGRIPSYFGWAIYGIFVLLNLLYLKYEITSLSDEYLSQYLYPSQSPISRVFQSTKFFGVLVILILFYSSKTKKATSAALVASIVLIVVNFLFVSLSMPFIYALTVLICVDKFLWKIKAWQLAIILVASSAVSFIIDHTRALGVGMNLLNFAQTERSVDLTHIFVNMGGSVTTVLRTIEFSAENTPLLGYSFVEPLLFIFPRPLYEAIGIYATEFRPSEWILQYSADVPVGGGLGYSLVAEAYLNFRMFGSGVFLLIGWILAGPCFSHSPNRQRLSEILILNFAILLALHMRNDCATYFRILFWSYMLIVFFRFWSKSGQESSPLMPR